MDQVKPIGTGRFDVTLQTARTTSPPLLPGMRLRWKSAGISALAEEKAEMTATRMPIASPLSTRVASPPTSVRTRRRHR